MSMLCYCICVIFFFKQKTAYEMRISDWSSDVCSSDLRWFCIYAIGTGRAIAFAARCHDRLSRRLARLLGFSLWPGAACDRRSASARSAARSVSWQLRERPGVPYALSWLDCVDVAVQGSVSIRFGSWVLRVGPCLGERCAGLQDRITAVESSG